MILDEDDDDDDDDNDDNIVPSYSFVICHSNCRMKELLLIISFLFFQFSLIPFFQDKEWSDYASFAHDAVWTYALALDRLLNNDTFALDSVTSNATSA